MTNPSHLTRRRFLQLVSMVGGTTPLWNTMSAWGLLGDSMRQRPPELDDGGAGVSVAVLGGGLAGLTTAYELGQRGYDCTVLEARSRPGGRVYTIRSGTRVSEMGREPVICDFDDDPDLYLNAGAWRIPHHHASTLYYCKLFGVPLEVMLNTEHAGMVRADGINGELSGQRMHLKALRTDMQGYASELLSKAIDQGALDDELSAEDGEALTQFLVDQFDLNADDFRYAGTIDARGYKEVPGAGDRPGELVDLPELSDLISYASSFSDIEIMRIPEHDYQMTMFQARGGMDRIPQAFAEALGDTVIYDAEITGIHRGEGGEGAQITYNRNGSDDQLTADYAVVALPASIASRIANDFSPEVVHAMRSCPYSMAGKAGLQMSRRFWEEDQGIYGGHSWYAGSDWPDPIEISYPSAGLFGQKGVIQGYYPFGPEALRVSEGNQAERIEYALAAGSAMHDGYREHFETGISHSWMLEYYSLGCYGEWSEEGRETAYKTLLEPDGPFYFAGEHLSYLNAWMAGAFESAWDTIERLHQRARQEAAS